MPVESSGYGILTPSNLELCFTVIIFGDNLVEDPLEMVHLRVSMGSAPPVDINVNIQDDDKSKLGP